MVFVTEFASKVPTPSSPQVENMEKFESTSSPLKLERSKTERQRHPNGPGDANQIFSDKLSATQKVLVP